MKLGSFTSKSCSGKEIYTESVMHEQSCCLLYIPIAFFAALVTFPIDVAQTENSLMFSEGYSKQQSSLGRVLCLLDLHIAPIINEPEVFLRHIVCFCFPTFIANTYWTNSAAMVTVEWHLSFKSKQLTCMNLIDGITI